MIETTVTLTVWLDGRYDPGSESTFRGGQWFPGDPPSVNDLKVMLCTANAADCIDITQYLSEDELDSLQDEFAEHSAFNS